MDQLILDLIKRKGGSGVSMAELDEIPGFTGNRDCEWGRPDLNITFWILSHEAADALGRLVKENKITVNPCDLLIYMIDGEILKLPIAKRNRKYKELHWLPVTMGLVKK